MDKSVDIDSDENDDNAKSTKAKFFKYNKHLLKWKPPENDDQEINFFDVEKAWEAILDLPSCQEFMMKPSVQKSIRLLVGVNVTQEFPWKILPCRLLRARLFSEISHSQFFYSAFSSYEPDHHVLIGYVPWLTQNMDVPPDGDPFILFIDPEDAKLALTLIRNIETYERLISNRKIVKKPKIWFSLGSENEICTEKLYHDPISVEIQSVYPMSIPANRKFSFRKTSDVRDGYVELLPGEIKFDILQRKRVHMAIQSNPPRITVEQQTDPTFPMNAWAQYLYEIKENDVGLDPDTEDEESKDKVTKKKISLKEKPPPEVSDVIKFLLNHLEFNQIDMYRNDYNFISNIPVMRYTTPYLEESLCFANISKSNQRFVCGYDWYPAMAGLIVTSYTFSTPSTIDSVNKKVDYVQRAVLEPNPILMWSFSDNLNYKLEFESPLEIITLSFCPYDSDLLFGGAYNGQMIMWDLQQRAERFDYHEVLTAAQSRYRSQMAEHFTWTIQVNEEMIISPVTISKIEFSQRGPITGIDWFGRRFSINSFGKVYADPNLDAKHRYFVSCAMDGTISFWNLDSSDDKKTGTVVRRNLPATLLQSESAYKQLVLKPIYSISCNDKITAIIADTSVSICIIKETTKAQKNPYNYPTDIILKNPREVRQSLVISTIYGHINGISWQGVYGESEGREQIHTFVPFARVHDGPIVAMKKNPFFPWIFASIGRNIVAVWKENYNYSPIMWRKRLNDLTAVAWSESKPSVLFLTRIDGSLEAWDILSRDDDACVNDVLGGGIVTKICEHRPKEPEKLLGIGDYNSSLRMVKLPLTLYHSTPEQKKDMKNYILKEEARKISIQEWERLYYEKNKDLIEAKRQAEIEAHKEVERLEKERVFVNVKKSKEEDEEKTTAPINLSYTERMKKQWYDLNLKRLLSILMSRKRVNEKQLMEETALEKQRLAYEEAKKISLQQVLGNIAKELAKVRSQILPEEVPDLQRTDMIINSINEIFNVVDSYDKIESEANDILNRLEEFRHIDYTEILSRGTKRRKNLIKSLGGNTERYYWYENLRNEQKLDECNWGFDFNTDLLLSVDLPMQVSTDSQLFEEGDESRSNYDTAEDEIENNVDEYIT